MFAKVLNDSTKTLGQTDKPVWTLFSTFTLPFHPKRANVRTIAFVIWSRASKFEQHVTHGLGLTNGTNSNCAITISNLHQTNQQANTLRI